MIDHYYWVVHTIGDQRPYLLGPYKSREGAENRMEKCRGGQVDILRSFERTPQGALDEYRSKAGVS